MHERRQGTRGGKNEDCPACRLLTIFLFCSNSFNKYSLNAYCYYLLGALNAYYYYYLLGAILGAWGCIKEQSKHCCLYGNLSPSEIKQYTYKQLHRLKRLSVTRKQKKEGGKGIGSGRWEDSNFK